MRSKYYVYFIQHDVDGPIKIGVAKDPARRLNELQIGNPYQLYLITKIDCCTSGNAYALEKKLHWKFKRWNISGEWFKPRILKK